MSGPSARNNGRQEVQILRKRITYLNTSAVTIGKIPAGASVTGGGVHVVTAFNDSGTDVVDVGYIGSTTVAAAYASALDLSAVGFIALDELASTTNIQGTVEHTVTAVIPARTATDRRRCRRDHSLRQQQRRLGHGKS
jgi:hypothetical protein